METYFSFHIFPLPLGRKQTHHDESYMVQFLALISCIKRMEEIISKLAQSKDSVINYLVFCIFSNLS